MNKTIVGIVVILVVLTGGYFLLRGRYQAPAPAPEVPAPAAAPEEVPAAPEALTREITVSGTEFSLNPSSVTVKAGEKVRLTFKNVGRVPHNWTIEGLGVATKTIGGGKTDTVDFTAPVSGTHSFFCSVPGHRESGMVGTLKVE